MHVKHKVSRHADSPEGENRRRMELPRTSQETVNGMAWHCQKEMKYHHKFSQFTNSQSKKCHNVSRRSDSPEGENSIQNSRRDCRWDGMVLSERDEISPQVFTVDKFTVKEVSRCFKAF